VGLLDTKDIIEWSPDRCDCGRTFRLLRGGVVGRADDITKVKGVLLDSRGNKVQEKEVYSGNILSEKDLKEMSKGAVDKSLSSQFGISFSNVNIQPNKSVPFMIVFMDLSPDRGPGKPAADPAAKPGEAPAKLSDFTVEVISSQKGSK
jgi:hypothetical protein